MRSITEFQQRRPAFTLIELLVSVAVIAVLLSIALPAVQAVRESARLTTCRTNLEQFGVALRNYEGAHGTFPPGYIHYYVPYDPLDLLTPPLVSHESRSVGSGGGVRAPYLYDGLPPFFKPPPNDPGWNWLTMILPQLEQKPLYDQIELDLALWHPENVDVLRIPLDIATCPSDTGNGLFAIYDVSDRQFSEAETTSYVACFGSFGLINIAPDDGNGMFQRNSSVRADDVTDGLTNTMAIGERAAAFAKAPWHGAMTGGTVRTTPGAPVFGSTIEQSPCMTLARIGTRTFQDRFSEPYDFFSMHRGQVNFVYADGTVRGLAEGVDLNVLHALATKDGHEAVQSP